MDVCFSNNGEYLASCSKDNTIKIWKGSHVTENIHEYVIEKMKTWQKKGEFEKVSDYKKRMEKRNDKVVELTYEALNNFKNEYLSTITWDVKIIGDYDAEQETFEIEIPIAGVVALKVPIDDAESFKNNEANLQIIYPDLKFNNNVVLTSSKDDQVSSWYNGKKHGMFTYFLLKAIHNKNADINNDNQITYEEIYEYISDNSEGIPYYARRIHGIEQIPTIFGKNKENVAIQY